MFKTGSKAEEKFLKDVIEYFGVEAWFIKAVIKELEDNTVEDITLTEQFNRWFIEGMKKSAQDLEQFFEENVKQWVDDFREIDPNANVEDTEREFVDTSIEDIVKTDKITDWTWNI